MRFTRSSITTRIAASIALLALLFSGPASVVAQGFTSPGGTFVPPTTGGAGSAVPLDALSVKSYGATGNGVSDDRVAINSAISAAITANKSLLFPPGTYKTSKYIDVANANGLRIYGVGATIRYPSDDTGLVADGTAASSEQARAGILVRNSSNVTIEGLTFIGGNAQSLTDNLGSSIYATRSSGTTVRGCTGLRGYALFVQDAFADTNGTGDSVTTAASGVSTLTDAAGAFNLSHVGRQLTLAGFTNAQNNGSFVIKSYVSATQITFENAAATAETSSFRWTINDGDRGTLIAGNRSFLQRGPIRTGNDSVIRDNLIERPMTVDAAGLGDYLSISGTTVTLTDVAGRFKPLHDGKYIGLAGQPTSGALSLGITAATATLTRGSGSFVTDGFAVGQRVVLTGYANGGNNTTKVLATVAALTMTFADNTGLVDEAGTGDEIANSGNNSGQGNPLGWRVTYVSSTQVSFTNANGFTGAFSGSWWIANGEKVGLGAGATAIAKSGSTITLTSATNSFVASDVGKAIRIAKATTAGNNGAWVISAYVGPTQVQFINASGASETFSGFWSVDPYDHVTDGTNTYGSTHGVYIFAGRSNIKIIGNTFRGIRSTTVKVSGSSLPIRDIEILFNTAEECGDAVTAGADDSQEHTGIRIEGNTFIDVGTNTPGRSNSHVINILGSRGTIVARNHIHFTHNAIGSVDGRGVAGIVFIDAARYVDGVSQPLEDLTIEGNKFTVDVQAVSSGNLVTSIINARSVGLRAKYRTGGTLTRHSTGNITMGVTAASGTFTRSAGSFITDGFYVGGSFVTTGYANGGNNTTKTIATVSATVITVTSNAGLVDEAGSGDETASNGTMTLSDSSAKFAQEDVGKSATFVFSASAANDVTATVLTATTTTFTFINTAGVAGSLGGTYRIPERSGRRPSFLRIVGNEIDGFTGDIGLTANVGTELTGNIWSNASVTVTGDATPRIAFNREIGTNTANSKIRLRDGTSWPIVHDNTITNQGIGTSSARDISVSSGPNGTTPVDYPLLGKRGRIKPTQAQQQVVFAYGSNYVDGDTVVANGTTYTYKASSPGGSQFNSFSSLVSLIDGQAGFSAADFGSQFSPTVATQHIRIWRDAANTADGVVTLSASTLNPTAAVVLRNQTGGNTSAMGRGAASTTSTTPDRSVIWTPLATWAGNVTLVADNEAARTLLGAGSVATGTITCTTKANYVDGELMATIGDGIRPAVVYEADPAANGVTAGNIAVNISTDTTAAQVCARVKTAIDGAQPVLTVTDNTGSLSLAQKVAGIFANVTITEGVANAGHTVSGFVNGAAGGYRHVKNSDDAGACELLQHATSVGTEEFRWTEN